MAKPFYSIDEVAAKLGMSQDQVKGLVREGTLREFRDAGKVFFKAEDVDKYAARSQTSKSDTGEITLEAADADLPSLASSGGTSVIGLEPLGDEDRPAKKEDTVITASGIGVFDDEELEIDADPMAKTQITAGTVGDQVSLEGTGSGSGLLDLTREADDTSLGAELLDEIYPGEEEVAPAKPVARKPAPAKKADTAVEEAVTEADTGEVVAPVMVATGDPLEGVFSGMLVGALLLMVVTGTVAAGVVQGYFPDYGRVLSNNFWAFLGGSVGLIGLAILIGWFVGKAMMPKRRLA